MPRVAFGAVDEVGERVVVDRQVLVREPARVVERALEQIAEVVGRERLEPEQRRARQQRRREREERVLRRRSDQHHEPLFDVRQQRVLLGAAEAVHLVEEEDRAAPVLTHPGTRALRDFAHVLHPR